MRPPSASGGDGRPHGSNPALGQIATVVHGGKTVELAERTRGHTLERKLVELAAERGDVAYGLSTGVGARSAYPRYGAE